MNSKVHHNVSHILKVMSMDFTLEFTLPRLRIVLRFCFIFFISYEISVQFSHSVMSDSLRPHELQHTRLPCPTPTPAAY